MALGLIDAVAIFLDNGSINFGNSSLLQIVTFDILSIRWFKFIVQTALILSRLAGRTE